jgi:hypothetical protein
MSGAAAPSGDAIPRVGLSFMALERFCGELAEATRGLPGAYVPGDGKARRKLHEHALGPLVAKRRCDLCRRQEPGEATWHSCPVCGYDECASCFAESERLAALPPEPPLMTTAEVSALATTHLTGARRCAYIALLDASDASLVGDATTFASTRAP